MVRPKSAPLLLTIAMIASLALVEVAKSEGRRDYFGVGSESCGAWINARAQSNTARHGSWVLGYISALNIWGVIGRKDALKNIDADGIYQWLDTYCQKNPLETIATAAGKLVSELNRRSR